MKFLFTLAALTGLAFALPSVQERDAPQTVDLTFNGATTSYNMTFPADGIVRATPDQSLSIDTVVSDDYILRNCKFNTKEAATITYDQTPFPNPSNQAHIGRPQPVLSVSCQGMCVTTYGDCYVDGQMVGPCCNGLCAANKCRPWPTPN